MWYSLHSIVHTCVTIYVHNSYQYSVVNCTNSSKFHLQTRFLDYSAERRIVTRNDPIQIKEWRVTKERECKLFKINTGILYKHYRGSSERGFRLTGIQYSPPSAAFWTRATMNGITIDLNTWWMMDVGCCNPLSVSYVHNTTEYVQIVECSTRYDECNT